MVVLPIVYSCNLFSWRIGNVSENKGMMLSRYEMAELYMILGGIPYYLNLLDERLSLAQNIDRMLFNPNGQLYNEFRYSIAPCSRILRHMSRW